jgi:hypothetical protein
MGAGDGAFGHRGIVTVDFEPRRLAPVREAFEELLVDPGDLIVSFRHACRRDEDSVWVVALEHSLQIVSVDRFAKPMFDLPGGGHDR